MNTRRTFLTHVAGTAAITACGLPSAKASTSPAKLPSEVLDGLRSVLQALAIAKQSLEMMKKTPEVLSDDEDDDDCPGVGDLDDMIGSVANHEIMLTLLGATSKGPVSAAVDGIRKYQHRFRRNVYGSERATLALEHARQELEVAWLSLDVDDEADGVIRGLGWTLHALADIVGSSVVGEIREEEWDRSWADLPRLNRKEFEILADRMEAKRLADREAAKA